MSAFAEAVASLIESLRTAVACETPAREIRSACHVLSELSIPKDLRSTLDGLAEKTALDPAPETLRGIAVDALAVIEAWTAPEFCEALLARSVSVLRGVGPKRADAMARRGLRTISDLLFHLPTRYDDRRALELVGDLEVGRRATFMAEVRSVEHSASRGGRRFQRIFQVVVGDDTGSVTLKWFRGAGSVEKELRPGVLLLVTGDVKRYRFSKEIVHPEVETVDQSGSETGDVSDSRPSEETLRSVVPDYPVPDGVNPRTLRRLIGLAVEEYADLVEGCLPAKCVLGRGLPGMGLALRLVHRPELKSNLADYEAHQSPAHERLSLEELYLLELGLVLRKASRRGRPGIGNDIDCDRVRAAPQSFPFVLTGAQARVWAEVASDLAAPHPMNRLLQGDVGSGKTAIALLAAVAVAANGRQAALMAPTELLAEQHQSSMAGLATAGEKVLGIRIALLTASVPNAAAAAIRAGLLAGEIDLLIGTHALIQEKVEFRDLALAIIDEQHRFGVRQRAALADRARGNALPDVLVMTATPIPRTLALSAYGELDVSVIDELPPGRRAPTTLRVQEGEGERIMEMIRDTTARGEQVYVVYPLVEESEKIDLRSAMQSAEKITQAFPTLCVDLLHGRLDAEERNRVMARFRRGEIQILVATTVIEVGVDVPNATLMIIEHAERFGLAQLHQLRGRVGRGEQAGVCVLVSRGGGRDSKARLRAMLDSNDGFQIADADLEIRGPGEFLGTRQSGDFLDLRTADLVRDARLVSVARDLALMTVRKDPGLALDARLRRSVEAHWGERLDLLGVG